MTLGQFFLGMVAIIVATVVYRWQKAIDRQTSHKSELARLYAAYISALTKHDFEQPFIGEQDAAQKALSFASIGETEAEIYVLRDQIYLLAPEEIIEQLKSCDKAFRNWKIGFHTDGRSKEDVKALDNQKRKEVSKLMDAMRDDLAEHLRFDIPLLAKVMAHLGVTK